jgi:hypothetical protein
MTDTHCVEIELELLRHDVGPTSRVPARPHDGSRPGTAANKDVDHIGAIDNTTRKLMHEGQRPSESRGVRARRGTVR